MRDHREGADPTVRIPIDLGPIADRLELGEDRRCRRDAARSSTRSNATKARDTADERRARRKAAANSRRRNR